MDFQIENVQADDATRIVRFQLIPDPRRYKQVERDGESYFLDKYLHHIIKADEMMRQCAEKVAGLPIYHLSSSIKSAPDYAAARRSALGSELRGGSYVAPTEKTAPHRNLDENTATKWLVFLSVDICGGTALRRADPAAFERAYKIFLRELGTVVGQFNGAILKTTGDGLIAYIDHPSFTQQSDNAIDMGLSFLVLLRDSINPALAEAALPQLAIRVGADCGDAAVRHVEIPLTGYSAPEVASDALNRAVKIEQDAQENEFRIGRGLYELIHVVWLERAEEIPFDGESVGMPGYKTYRMT
jgi:class 3 adenylate cyclase